MALSVLRACLPGLHLAQSHTYTCIALNEQFAHEEVRRRWSTCR